MKMTPMKKIVGYLFLFWASATSRYPYGQGFVVVSELRRTSFTRTDRDSLLHLSLRTSLDRFVSTCHDNGIEIVSRSTQPTDSQIPIQAILIEQEETLKLFIVPEKCKLDAQKVQDALNATEDSSVKILSNDEAIEVLGFPQNLMPPIGHPQTVDTFVDKTLMEHAFDDHCLYCPAGYASWRCLVKVHTLSSLKHVQVADLVASSKDAETFNFPKDPAPSRSFESIPKPIFPGIPPSIHVARTVLGNPELGNPLESPWISFAGQLGPPLRKKESASETFECYIFPVQSDEPAYLKLQKKDLQPASRTKEDRKYPWRSATDGHDMRVKLSIGKALLQRLGKTQGQARIDSLREDELVYVEAKPNVLSRDSLRLWVNENTLELVVFQCKPLNDQSQQKTASHPTTKPSRSQALNLIQLKDCWRGADGEGIEPSITMVNDLESTVAFHACLSNLIHKAENNEFNIESFCVDSGAMVGMDCEWRPEDFTKPGEYQPILILQVCFYPMRQVFILDFQALLRPLQQEDEGLNTLEKEVSNALSDLFASTRLLKVGYRLVSDLQRMAASYPHMKCFRQVESVLEVSTLVKRILHVTKQKRSTSVTMSLARLVNHYTGKILDKANQVSDWAERPLTSEQIHYCALDAAIPPLLVKRTLTRVKGATIDGNVPIITDGRLSKGIYSWRFSLLEDPDDREIRKTKAVRLVGEEWIASESWISGRDEKGENTK